MKCDICGENIVGADKNAVIKDGIKAHKTCYVKVSTLLVTKPGPDLEIYPDKALSKDHQECIADNVIGELPDENTGESKVGGYIEGEE